MSENELKQNEIIRMAREVGIEFDEFPHYSISEISKEQLNEFATLVAAHERNRNAWTQEHWTEYEHAIAAAEREACAKVCDEIKGWPTEKVIADECAAAIRARNEK